jgi:hypothetical protein
MINVQETISLLKRLQIILESTVFASKDHEIKTYDSLNLRSETVTLKTGNTATDTLIYIVFESKLK